MFSLLGFKIGFLTNILQFTNTPLTLRLHCLFWPSHYIHNVDSCAFQISLCSYKQKAFRNSVLAFTWVFQSDPLQQNPFLKKQCGVAQQQFLSECLPIVFVLVKEQKVCSRDNNRESGCSLTCLHLEFHHSSNYSFV